MSLKSLKKRILVSLDQCSWLYIDFKNDSEYKNYIGKKKMTSQTVKHEAVPREEHAAEGITSWDSHF